VGRRHIQKELRGREWGGPEMIPSVMWPLSEQEKVANLGPSNALREHVKKITRT